MLKGKNFLLKRVISCVLVCAMILGLIPQSVYAAPSEGTDTQKTYSSDGFTITYKEASAWDNYVNAEITLETTRTVQRVCGRFSFHMTAR